MRLWNRTVFMAAVLVLGACKPHSTTDSSSKASDSDKPTKKSASAKADGSAKAVASASTPSTAKTADGSDHKAASMDSLLADSESQKESSGVLAVDLSKVDDEKAPALGGGAAPPPAPAGTKVEWLPAAGLLIPNPSWKKVDGKEAAVLINPDQKSMVLFSDFGTPQEGGKKVDTIIAQMKMKNPQWKKPTAVTLGPDKVPALLGVGHAISANGKGAKLFYMLIKTGQPKNILAIGGADDDAPKNDIGDAATIVANIKRK